MKNTELYEMAKLLHEVLVAVSTGKNYDDTELVFNYQITRKALMQNRAHLMCYLILMKRYRDLPAFWGYIKNEHGRYADRRRYLGEVFAPLFDYLEQCKDATPIDSIMANSTDITSEYVREIWDKAIERQRPTLREQ